LPPRCFDAFLQLPIRICPIFISSPQRIIFIPIACVDGKDYNQNTYHVLEKITVNAPEKQAVVLEFKASYSCDETGGESASGEAPWRWTTKAWG
jgi:hypothetical protein